MNSVDRPVLYFSSYALSKMNYIAKSVQTEVNAFGITNYNEPNVVIDISIPEHEASHASVELDGAELSKYIVQQYKEFNREPRDCARVWIHTHPKGVKSPSSVDWKTFTDDFGEQDWSYMIIFPKESDPVGYLQMPKLDICIEVEIIEYTENNFEEYYPEWDKELQENVKQRTLVTSYVNTWNRSSKLTSESHQETFGFADRYPEPKVINPTKEEINKYGFITDETATERNSLLRTFGDQYSVIDPATAYNIMKGFSSSEDIVNAMWQGGIINLEEVKELEERFIHDKMRVISEYPILQQAYDYVDY